MIIFNHENLTAVDIDSTLVFTVTPALVINTVSIIDASSYDLTINDPYNHMGVIYLKKHVPNINLVKRCHARGDKLFAWSMAGAKWTAAVIKALDMEQYFEFAMAKPAKYIDDKPVEEWLNSRHWLDPNHVGSWQSE